VGAWAEGSAAVGVNGNQNDNSATNSGAAYVFTGLASLPPGLAIQRTNGNIRLVWPLSATGFLLQESPTLSGSPPPWIAVAPPYETNAMHIFAALPSPDGARFYRLRKP
jgi:hypothetical protein